MADFSYNMNQENLPEVVKPIPIHGGLAASSKDLISLLTIELCMEKEKNKTLSEELEREKTKGNELENYILSVLAKKIKKNAND